MKFFASAFLGLLMTISPPPVEGYANQWEAQIYNDMNANTVNKMWIFSQDGVRMFEPDGSDVVVYHKNTEVCEVVEDPWAEVSGVMQEDCWHMSAVNDGENYVFVNNGNYVEDSYVDVFSMWNGRYLGNIPMCSLAYNMMYSPNRRELWVDCWLRPADYNKSNMTDLGNVEVLSTRNIGAPLTHIDVHGFDAHNHGNILVHESIPNKAYRFTMANSNIYEIHAGSKRVLEEIAIDKSVGSYEYAFSPLNKHIFIRIYVCCACEDLWGDYSTECADCGEAVDVTFGPRGNTDMKQPGYCGKYCRGSLADTEGVWEFDTSTNTFVTQHKPLEGAHGTKPFATPRGDYILLGHGDGGNGVKVLKAGASGEASTEIGVINLDFAADSGTHALSDISFIEDDDRNIAVFTSTLNNHVVLVDMGEFDDATADSPVAVDGVDVDLFEEPQESIGVEHDIRGINIRKVRWAEGTPYVWVDSQATDQLHVIKLGKTISDAKTIKTIDNVAKTRQMLWVHNYELDAMTVTEAARLGHLNEIEETSDDEVLAIVGIALAAAALLLGIFNLIMSKNSKGDQDTTAKPTPADNQEFA